MEKTKRAKKIILLCFILDIVLTFAIIGVIITTMVINKSFKTYDDYSEYKVERNKMLKQDKDHYFVYIYSDTCHYCKKYKKRIFAYLDSKVNKGDNSLYLYHFNTKTDTDMVVDIEGKIDYSYQIDYNSDGIIDDKDLIINGFPYMLEVNMGQVVKGYLGANEIIEKLKTLKEE